MVVKIRLARWGVRNNPFYGVVVANARAPRDGRHLERVGTYNPVPDASKTKHIELDYARIKYWLGVGAQPTDRVAWLLEKAGLMPPLPKQLQRTGVLSLTDAKTWKVRFLDSATGAEHIRLPKEALTDPDLTSNGARFLEKVAATTSQSKAPPASLTARLLSRKILDPLFAKHQKNDTNPDSKILPAIGNTESLPKSVLSAKERLTVLREFLAIY
ncbi:hypothetical protein HK100_008988 [Physocladia obscura]|uniref:Ribosomal protein S16 n=1 Tax=Physocladia obscura TaxID=109957 RepID=A0AAD5XKZ2_9FUNG|nr:hypothetical protein HK100_008988 [Physocladia obscura]